MFSTWRGWYYVTICGDFGGLLLRASGLELGPSVGEDLRVEGTSK